MVYKKLRFLNLWYNQIKNIDLSSNSELERVNISNNPLVKINISNNPKLKEVSLIEVSANIEIIKTPNSKTKFVTNYSQIPPPKAN